MHPFIHSFSPAVFRATTRDDKVMYVVLLAAIIMGLVAKLTHAGIHEGYDYRATIAPWARSLFWPRPKTGLMAQAQVVFQVHAVIGLLLFALLPFTRLVHMVSAPIQYLFRPYIVYRSRDPRALGEAPVRRGWEAGADYPLDRRRRDLGGALPAARRRDLVDRDQNLRSDDSL